jgi:hypothetical protein
MHRIAMVGTVVALLAIVAARAEDLVRPAAPSHADGQNGNCQDKALLEGEYVPVSFWKGLKLGSQVFLNPKIVRDTKFVYSFNPQELFGKTIGGKTSSEQMLTLVKSGAVGLGLPQANGAGIKVVGFDDAMLQLAGKDPMLFGSPSVTSKSPDELAKLWQEHGVQIVAGHDDLFGSKYAEAWVKASGSCSGKGGAGE